MAGDIENGNSTSVLSVMSTVFTIKVTLPLLRDPKKNLLLIFSTFLQVTQLLFSLIIYSFQMISEEIKVCLLKFPYNKNQNLEMVPVWSIFACLLMGTG